MKVCFIAMPRKEVGHGNQCHRQTSEHHGPAKLRNRLGSEISQPANNEVQEYLLSLLSDLAKYKPDGIILDRCRYDDYGLMSDFSPESRTEFELFIGESVENFPADIMKPGTDIPGNGINVGMRSVPNDTRLHHKGAR